MNGKEERTRIGKEAYEKGHRFEEQFVENLAVYPAREFENEFRRPEKIREILQRQSKQPRRH